MADLEDADPSHQFQMILRPLRVALEKENLEAALGLAERLLEIGGGASKHEARKVQFLLSALDSATPSMRVEFTAQVVERFGGDLTDGARSRLAAAFERI